MKRHSWMPVFLLDCRRLSIGSMATVQSAEILHLAVLHALFEQGVFAEQRQRIAAMLAEQYENSIQEYDEPIPAILRELLSVRPNQKQLSMVQRLVWSADDVIFLVWPRWDGEDDAFTLSDLSGIEELTALETIHLDLAGAGLDLRPLGNCKQLRSIVIEAPSLSNIVALGDLPALTFLSLSLSEGGFSDAEKRALLALRDRGVLLGDELMVGLGLNDPDLRIESLERHAAMRGITEESNPGGYAVHLSHVARIQAQAARLEQAIELFERELAILLRIGEYAGQAAENLAALYERQGNLTAAIASLERYWQQKPTARNYISGFDVGARLYKALGRPARALWALFKDAHHAYGEGRFYTEVHDLVRQLSLEELNGLREEIHRDHPGEAIADLLIALKLFQEGALDQAKPTVDAALAADEYHPLLNYLKGVLCGREERHAEAAEHYSVALEFDRRGVQIHRARTFNNRIDALLRAENLTEADQCLSEALAELGETKYATIYSTAAETAFLAGRLEEAAQYVHRGLQLGFDFRADVSETTAYGRFLGATLAGA